MHLVFLGIASLHLLMMILGIRRRVHLMLLLGVMGLLMVEGLL